MVLVSLAFSGARRERLERKHNSAATQTAASGVSAAKASGLLCHRDSAYHVVVDLVWQQVCHRRNVHGEVPVLIAVVLYDTRWGNGSRNLLCKSLA